MKKEDAFALIDDYFLFINTRQSKIFSTLVIQDFDEWLSDGITFDFFGGECLLYPGLIGTIIDYMHESCIKNNRPDIWEHFSVKLETNGTLIQQTKVKELLTAYKDKIECAVTFEGCAELHDRKRHTIDGKSTYNIVKENILFLQKFFGTKQFDNKLTFDDDTIELLPAAIKGLSSLGYYSTKFSFNCEKLMTKEQSERYYKAMCDTIDWIVDNNIRFYLQPCMGTNNTYGIRTAGCGAAGAMCCIGPGGLISACQMTNESYWSDNSLAYGDVYNGITNIEMLGILRYRHHDLQIPVHCKNCPISNACGECPINNLRINGSVYKITHNCGETVAYARAQQYFLKKLELNPDYPYYQKTKEFIKTHNNYDPNYRYLYLDDYKTDFDFVEDKSSTQELPCD